MRYSGGKYRQRRDFVPAILAHTPNRERYLEPFVGGGAMLERMAPHFADSVVGDIHPDLVLMWQAVLDGWEPPDYVSKEYWVSLRDSDLSSPERAFAGFGVSFCGRFFSAWANHAPDAKKYHHTRASKKSLLKTADILSGSTVTVVQASYDEHTVEPGDVVYCDPPYADTAGTHYQYMYDGAAVFDHVAFWQKMDEWVERGAHVYVSEYKAPEHWVPLVVSRVKTTTGSNSRGGDNPVGYAQRDQVDVLWVPAMYAEGYPARA